VELLKIIKRQATCRLVSFKEQIKQKAFQECLSLSIREPKSLAVVVATECKSWKQNQGCY